MNDEEYLARVSGAADWHKSRASGLADVLKNSHFCSALNYIIQLQEQAIVNMAMTDDTEGLLRVKELRDNHRGLMTMVSTLCELATKEDENV